MGGVRAIAIMAVVALGSLIALLGARGYRQRLHLLATATAASLADILDGDREPPVTLRARTLRHGYEQLQAPASTRPCIWWSLRIRTHKRASRLAIMKDPGGVLTASSPHPFQLTDGARTVQVDPMELVVYGHPHSYRGSERLRRWDHTPPIVERLRRLRPDLTYPLERGTWRLDYTEWLIEEGEEVTITGRLDTDPDTGEPVLRAYTPPGHLSPVYHLTPRSDHTDVEELRRTYRRKVAVGYFWLLVGGTCVLGGLFAFLADVYG